MSGQGWGPRAGQGLAGGLGWAPGKRAAGPPVRALPGLDPATPPLRPPPLPRSPRDAYLGYLGPVLRAEVGDTIEVVFKNSLRFPGEGWRRLRCALCGGKIEAACKDGPRLPGGRWNACL